MVIIQVLHLGISQFLIFYLKLQQLQNVQLYLEEFFHNVFQVINCEYLLVYLQQLLFLVFKDSFYFLLLLFSLFYNILFFSFYHDSFMKNYNYLFITSDRFGIKSLGISLWYLQYSVSNPSFSNDSAIKNKNEYLFDMIYEDTL